MDNQSSKANTEKHDDGLGEHDTVLGSYVRANVCTNCEWFAKPSADLRMLHDAMRSVCPSCGAPTQYAVGRYRYYERSGIFSTHTVYVGFERANREPIDGDGSLSLPDRLQMIAANARLYDSEREDIRNAAKLIEETTHVARRLIARSQR